MMQKGIGMEGDCPRAEQLSRKGSSGSLYSFGLSIGFVLPTVKRRVRWVRFPHRHPCFQRYASSECDLGRMHPRDRYRVWGARIGPVALLDASLVGEIETRKAPWTPSSWRCRPAHQQPVYSDPAELARVEQTLRSWPGLVTPAAIRLLREQLAAACLGEAFVIQGGDCAETFSASFAEDNTRLYQLLAGQAALLSSAGARRRMIRIGRVAGQFAKPRSSPVDADGLPSFRGDIVHSSSANKAARTPDPQRLLQAYRYAATSLEQLAILGETHRSTRKSLESLLERLKADGLAASKLALTIECLAHGSEECNAPTRDRGERDTISGANIVPAMFTSHEALLLPYEESLVRLGDEALLGEAFDGVAATKSADTWADLPTDARYYATSAHFLWVGERTRQLNAAHIEFFRGIANPVGVKLSGNITLEELYALAELLNPLNTPGRLTLITRMGASTLGCKLPSLMAAARRAGLALVWVCDPMHANTITVQDSSGRRFKTRDYEAIQNELRMFLDIAASEGVPAGGIHLEMSGDSVTECLGGVTQTKTDDLARAYRSACDPRLNYAQALSLALTTSDSIQLTDVVAGSPRPVV